MSVAAPEPVLDASVASAGTHAGLGTAPVVRPRTSSQTALGWLLPGLEELLLEARASLEEFFDGEQASASAACALALHRAGGCLEMLEQYALGLLTKEMEAVAGSLCDKAQSEADEAAELLMRAILELGDYLQLLVSGRPGAASLILPVINDLRSLRGQSLLTEGALFNPNLGAALPDAGPRAELTEARVKGHARQLRGHLQRGLLGWHRGKPFAQGLGIVQAVTQHLEKLTTGTPYFRLWWVTSAVSEALVQGGLRSEPALRRVLMVLDAELGRMGEGGLAVLESPPPAKLLKNLLYFVARSTSDGERVRTVKRAFNLETDVIRTAEGAIGGADLSARRTVAEVVREELKTVRDGLDAYCRTGQGGTDWIPGLAETVKRLSDTLAMLNFGPTHKRLATLAATLRDYAEASSPPDDSALMNLAGEVLSIDSALSIVAKGGINRDELLAQPEVRPECEGDGLFALPADEAWQLDIAVIREVAAELSWAKSTFSEHLVSRSGGSSRFTGYLRRAAGGLDMLNMPEASAAMREWGDLANQVLGLRLARPPTELLDQVAEALEALVYVLESEVGLGIGDRNLQPVRTRLRSLRTRVEAVPRDCAAAPVVPAQPSGPPRADAAALQVDEDILAIFLEEAREAFETLRINMQRWQDDPDNREALVTVRRAFHTLKGSGRMVGAIEIGDFAWTVENLLNRVIDGLCPVTGAVLEVASDGAQALPALLEDFRQRRSASVDIVRFARRAESALSEATGRTAASSDTGDTYAPAAGQGAPSAPLIGEPGSDYEPGTQPMSDSTAASLDFQGATLGQTLLAGVDALVPSSPVAASGSAVHTAVPGTGQPLQSTSAGVPEGEQLLDHDDPRQVFQVEAGEILDLIDALLRHWRQEPEDKGCVTALQRELHTLKGGARICSITAMGDLAHEIENLLGLVMDGRCAARPSLVDLVERSHDRLADMLEAVRAGEVPADAVALIHELEEFALGGMDGAGTDGSSGQAPATSGAEGETPPGSPGVPRRNESESDVRGGRAAGSRNRAVLGAGRPGTVLGRGDRIQVPSAFLDSLAGFAGELNISQVRMGQQVGSFRHNLEEMEQTIMRLRDQLRRLQLETDSGAEPERREPAHPEFDPLEMDRYTRVQQLSQGLAESLSDLESIRELLQGVAGESGEILTEQVRVSRDLHQGLLRTRMLSISGLVQRFRRLVRSTTSEVGNQVELDVQGGDIQLDRAVLDLLTPSLEHMLRNAIDHGIEKPEERRAKGKPDAGTIQLSFARVGAEMEIRISDDGRGLDLDAMLQTARARGLIAPDQELEQEEFLRVVLEPGFSTAREVTQISGRGVGLDVVNSDVKQLGGTLQIETRADHGCTFIIRVPFTLALNHVLLVETAGEPMALPLGNVHEVMRVPVEQLKAAEQRARPEFEHQGVTYPLIDLGSALGLGEVQRREGIDAWPVVLIKAGESVVALSIDELAGRHEIAIKPLVPPLIGVRWVTGATILGDGRVALILDVQALIRRCLSLHEEALPETPREAPARDPQSPPLIMVVDDSITVRRVTQRLLERHALDVVTAKDGMEALELAQEHAPDLILLDIEMPRMDGFQLAAEIRGDDRWRDIPIIMISSRTGEKHAERAQSLGVQTLLGKPYQDAELLTQIGAILGPEYIDG